MRLLSCLFATILMLGIVLAAPAKAGKAEAAWAACLWRNAPVSSQNWVALGKPVRKMEQAAAQLSDSLAFRLKTACSKTVYPGIAIKDVAFDKAAVWQSLSKSAPAVAQPANTISEGDPGAFFCRLYFIAADVSGFQADAKSIPEEMLRRAPLSIGFYEVLSDSEQPVRLTSAKQSDGSPTNLLRKCKRISTNGNLIDA